MKALKWANAWNEAATVRAWKRGVANDRNDSLEDTAIEPERTLEGCGLVI